MAFPPFFTWKWENVRSYNTAADSARVELPQRLYAIIWRVLVALTGKLEEVWPQGRHRSNSLSGPAAVHSTLFLRLTQKPEFIKSGWKPLLLWQLFSGEIMRGVLTSGLNKDIWQVGCLTELHVPVTDFSNVGGEVQFY